MDEEKKKHLTIESNKFSRMIRNPSVSCILLLLLTVCTFLPTLKNNFIILDDPIYVLNNSHVNHGLTWDGLRWAFFGTDGGIWLPLIWISHMLDCQFYGLKPWGHHLTSTIIHAVNTSLVFLWLFRMTGATGRSLVVAALFGLHPLRVESVAWVAERKDVLSALFWLLTLLAYTSYVKKIKIESSTAKLFYALALIFFALGLMAKPMLVTLPFVLLLLDYWPFKRLLTIRSIVPLMLEKLPFFALSVLASIVTFVVQRHENMVMPLNRLPLFVRVENAIISYLQYIGHLFWPENLCIFYPFPHYLSFGVFFSAAVLLLIISGIFIWQWRRSYLLVGWLWYLGTLIPVIGLVQVGQQAMADRYTYIPQIGLLFCLIWGLSDSTKAWKWRVPILSTTATLGIITCMILSNRQIQWWRNSETLFEHAVAVTKNNVVAQINLGNAFAQEGQTDKAIIHYQIALKMDSSYANAQYNLGTAFFQKEQFEEAIIHYQKALAIKPNYTEARDNLRSAHINLGLTLAKAGRISEAITNFEAAVKIGPSADLCNSLGYLLLKNGQREDAIVQYQKALEIEPDNADFLRNISIAYFEVGRQKEAVTSAQRALELAEKQKNAALGDRIKKQLEIYGMNSSPDRSETNSSVQPNRER